jgi:hypothetical protein
MNKKKTEDIRIRSGIPRTELGYLKPEIKYYYAC